MLLQGTVDLKLLWAFWTDKKEMLVGAGGEGEAARRPLLLMPRSPASHLLVFPPSTDHPSTSPLPSFLLLLYIYIFFFYSWQTEQDEGSVYLDGWRWNAVLKEEAVKLKFQNGAYLFVRLSTLSCLCPTLPLYLNHTSNNDFFLRREVRARGSTLVRFFCSQNFNRCKTAPALTPAL